MRDTEVCNGQAAKREAPEWTDRNAMGRSQSSWIGRPSPSAVGPPMLPRITATELGPGMGPRRAVRSTARVQIRKHTTQQRQSSVYVRMLGLRWVNRRERHVSTRHHGPSWRHPSDGTVAFSPKREESCRLGCFQPIEFCRLAIFAFLLRASRVR